MKLLNIARRALLVSAVLAWAAVPAWAQGNWPTKPVTLYTAFAPGSGPDVVARLVGQRLSEMWKQSVVVDNRPGGAGFVAMDAVRRLPADGYALLQLDSEHLAAVPHLYKSRNFQTLEVFDPVAPLFLTPFLVAVSSNSPWKNMGDLIAAAKTKPDSVTYGSWFVGSPGHLGGAWLDMLAGTQMVHAPYRQVSELYTAVANGDVAWAYGSIPSTQGVYQAGKLRYLAVATQKRIPQMPDLPTIAEAGGPQGIDVNSFVSLVAPKGLREPVRAKIHADVLKVLAEPAIRERFNTFAFQPLDWPVEKIRANAALKSRQYGELILKARISLD